jgi:hypothetical protein
MKNLVFPKFLFLVLIFLFSREALAEPDLRNGNFWYEQCSPKKSTAERGFCYAYIIGVFDGMASQAGLTAKDVATCRPDGVTPAQTADIFYAFLTKHPDIRHMDPGVLLVASIMDAFPCEKRPPLSSFDKK